jgi:hypothetical protein
MNHLRPVITSVWKLALACLLASCVASGVPSAPEQKPASISSPAQPTSAAAMVASPPPVQPSPAATAPLPVQLAATAVPAAPTATLDKATQAKALADNLAGATSDPARYEALLAVMQALAIGVYTPDGVAVLRGAERGPHDFYLYDFELGMMAASLGRQDAWSIADLTAALNEMGIRLDDKPLADEQFTSVLLSAAREADQTPADRLSLPLLLVRDLGLRQPTAYDLLIEPKQDALSFSALQKFLITIDIVLPIVREAKIASGPSRLVAESNGVLQLKPVSQSSVCDSMVATVAKEGWGAGKLFITLTGVANISVGTAGAAGEAGATLNVAAAALVTIDAIHGSMMAFSIKVEALQKVVSTHYGHATPGIPREIKISVTMRDKLPDVVVQCGWLLGVEFPKQGGIKDVKILWFYQRLDEHGEFVCPEDGCKKTGPDGVATLLFKPKQELQPYGFGPEYDATGFVGAVALYQSRLKNYLGFFNQILTPKGATTGYLVTYHKQPEFDFDFASFLDGTSASFRGSSVALLESPIHLKFDPAYGYTGQGTLHFETKPLPRQDHCDFTYSGSGTYPFVVEGGQITVDPTGATQIELDIATFPPLGLWENITWGCPGPKQPATWPVPFWLALWTDAHLDYFNVDTRMGFIKVTGWKYVQGARSGEIFAEKDWNTTCHKNECKDQTKLRLSLRPPE